MSIPIKEKIEYGDFQTPLELAYRICQKLIAIQVTPEWIIEPTCGVGHFIEAANQVFSTTTRIIGIEINPIYQPILQAKFLDVSKVEIRQDNFFQLDWDCLLNTMPGKSLILGNFPWVTNARQSLIQGSNLPPKTNFHHYQGLDAVTGKSNFDISEWMLIRVIEGLQEREGYLAMLCKTSVARKVLKYIYAKQLNLSRSSIYTVDARQYFGAHVEACLFFCEFQPRVKDYRCSVFANLDCAQATQIAYYNHLMVRDQQTFTQLSELYTAQSSNRWRSGIKHDCAKVMELRQVDGYLVNGLGEVVDVEADYLFPFFKGADIARTTSTPVDRWLILTQTAMGEPTEKLQNLAPRTWAYLEAHAHYLDGRKSRIYRNAPRFSIFGVGAYSFLPWKVAISGLHKKLEFCLLGPVDGKPILLDDTIYFLGFADRETARQVCDSLNSRGAHQFLASLIFWDEKRPIKAHILNCLNLEVLVPKYGGLP